MTKEQEKNKTSEYLNQITGLLCSGKPEDYLSLSQLCATEEYRFLMMRCRELQLFSKVMAIWSAEHAGQRTWEETLPGRTAAFLGISSEELTLGELNECYTIVKFAFFRLESGLSAEKKAEGVERALLLRPSPEFLILTARTETSSEEHSLEQLIAVMKDLTDEDGWITAMREVLEVYLVDKKSAI